jgi:hypothetical protein
MTLLGGLASYSAATAFALPYPFITSLACAVALYLAGGFSRRA